MQSAKVHPEKILVVEDNVSTVLFIQKAIFNVRPHAEIFSAVSLEEAFMILIKNIEIDELSPYRLIIADIFLEGTRTGLDLWRVLRSTYPQIPILVVSSLTEDRVSSALQEDEKKYFIYLKKPFVMPELQSKIKEVLAKNSQESRDDLPLDYKPDSNLLSSNEQLQHMAYLLMLKQSLDWLIKQNWVDVPYGGQNPVQELLFKARSLTETFWEDTFLKGDVDIKDKEHKLKEQILEICELTPELKDFFGKRLGVVETMFHHS